MKKYITLLLTLFIKTAVFAAVMSQEQMIDSLKTPLMNNANYRVIGDCQLSLQPDSSIKIYFPQRLSFFYLAYGDSIRVNKETNSENLILISEATMSDRTVAKLIKSKPNLVNFDRIEFAVYYWESVSNNWFASQPNQETWIQKFRASCK